MRSEPNHRCDHCDIHDGVFRLHLITGNDPSLRMLSSSCCHKHTSLHCSYTGDCGEVKLR